jgi:hypothetical protein
MLSDAITVVPNNDTCRDKFTGLHFNNLLFICVDHTSSFSTELESVCLVLNWSVFLVLSWSAYLILSWRAYLVLSWRAYLVLSWSVYLLLSWSVYLVLSWSVYLVLSWRAYPVLKSIYMLSHCNQYVTMVRR